MTIRITITAHDMETYHLNVLIDQIVIDVLSSGCAAQQESCENPERGENGDILCQYTSEGQKGTCKKVTMTVAGQSSNDMEFCYDVDKGEITGVPPGTQRVVENDTVAYEIGIYRPTVCHKPTTSANAPSNERRRRRREIVDHQPRR